MDGILPLWKTKGMTSHDCVFKVRKLLRTKKVGHTGTLDPEVEGVLPICIGEATKIVPYLTDTTKTYRAVAKVGFSTDTEDQTGTVTQQDNVNKLLEDDAILAALEQFVGETEQQVPLYSAVKVKGKKLYEYARANEPVERPIRRITVHNIRFLATTYDKVEKTQTIEFEVTCSKGTYIRTLCVDIGKALGYPAHMAHLVRTATGHIAEHETYTLAQLQLLTEEDSMIPLLTIDRALAHMDKIDISESTKVKVLHGQKFPMPEPVPSTTFFRMVYQQNTIAIYQTLNDKHQIKPARVFRFNERK
ncbi:tRNA pseudouridine(55) synthase TruB [Gracilibacillus caseinilyticus]|uniref:tRNA pseudouridine synthase B n=1 Tax=Gracilibacillus caseinilyticus TaxID=2932256 RepID=A0ABY4F073_9BACI|nr:tRNA pseudouridine(55) synthase TruB [Gracilibacillus caseinilyticus]UOQ47831.1 tRNA pseudouridine(55) synthase TruB [Gracilibacillus caseinilyticus]